VTPLVVQVSVPLEQKSELKKLVEEVTPRRVGEVSTYRGPPYKMG